jgi:hypothetical protein
VSDRARHVAAVATIAAAALIVYRRALGACFFVVQPSDVDAIAWVGALAEPASAFFDLRSQTATSTGSSTR